MNEKRATLGYFVAGFFSIFIGGVILINWTISAIALGSFMIALGFISIGIGLYSILNRRKIKARIEQQKIDKPIEKQKIIIPPLEPILPTNYRELTVEDLSLIISKLCLQLHEDKHRDISSRMIILNQLDEIRNFTDVFDEKIADAIIAKYYYSLVTEKKSTIMLIKMLKHDTFYKVFKGEMTEIGELEGELNEEKELDFEGYGGGSSFEETEQFIFVLNGQSYDGKLTNEDEKEIQRQVMKIITEFGNKLFKELDYVYALNYLVTLIRDFKIKEAFPHFKPYLKEFFTNTPSTDALEYDGDPGSWVIPFSACVFDFALLIRDFTTKRDLDLLEIAYTVPDPSSAVLILETLQRIGGRKAKKIIKEVSEDKIYYPETESSPHVPSEAKKLLDKFN